MFDGTKVPARERVNPDELAELRRLGAIITDDRRRRPQYFDGRFLAARDLTREQNYFLSRQADLGRTTGGGVVRGLMVKLGNDEESIEIDPGHGVTPGGELVVLTEPIVLRTKDLQETELLDAAFGLRRIPRKPARNRSGLYVLALRPVEYTANPIASYPTSITGQRSSEDGDIVEAVAVTLIFYPDQGSVHESRMRRARAAFDIFVSGARRGIPDDAVPLAMIALDGEIIDWIDPYLVRREVGFERGDLLGLGLTPRALREAGLLQYQQHLDDVVRESGGGAARFAATQHFLALPPAGRLPTATVNPADFTQMFFPPEVDVELSIIPRDELPALIDESLLLPAIDLTVSGQQLESTSVLVLSSVDRSRFDTLRSELRTIRRPLRSSVPILVARRSPLQSLMHLRPSILLRLPQPVDSTAESWRSLLRETGETLWYVRRRNIGCKVEILGLHVPVPGNEEKTEAEVEKEVRDRISEAGGKSDYQGVRDRATSAADSEILRLFASTRFRGSNLLTRVALDNLAQPELDEAGQHKPLDRVRVAKAAEDFGRPDLGEGLTRLEGALKPEDRKLKKDEPLIKRLREKRELLDGVDVLGRHTAQDKFATLWKDLRDKAMNADALASFITAKLGDVEP